MTSLSRRAFLTTATAATASLLVGCGGGNGNGSGQDAGAGASSGGTRAPARSSARTAPGGGRPIPVGLEIPAIGVDTAVMTLGLAPDGTVETPPISANDRAGWYRHSPVPGRKGPSVILGHVTVGDYGAGVFHRLARLQQDDRIVARLENGTRATFAVTSVRTVAKAAFPTEEVYGNVDRPELRLITCGGVLTGDGYPDNVIAFATLTSAGS
ncbi:class F sortase [Streptomyces sp. NPDC087851]|uniref:class F sortase n=1 Tax=Streptomyces sp. NPDC087851 TaxID=3365810 RepID=UPI0037F175AF